MMNIIVTILLLAGLFFFTGGAVGIIRFPDFYTRLHPAGKLDTMGLLMSMSAMALYTLGDFSISSVKSGKPLTFAASGILIISISSATDCTVILCFIILLRDKLILYCFKTVSAPLLTSCTYWVWPKDNKLSCAAN